MNFKSITESFLYPSMLTAVFCLSLSMSMSGCNSTGSDHPKSFIRTVSATDGTAEAAAWTRAIVKTGEGGYLLAGEIQTSDNGLDVYVVHLDKYGELVWEKTFGGQFDDRAYDLIRTREGDFVVLGTKRESRIYLLRIDARGNVEWERTYHRNVDPEHMAMDEGFAFTQTTDGGFSVAGRTSVPYFSGAGSAYVAPSVLRLDSKGKEVWFKDYYDGVGTGHALAIAQTPEGDFLIPGLYKSSWPFRITGEGTLVRPIPVGESGMVYADIEALGDDTYVMTGNGFNNSLITVTKMRSNGKEVWTNTYGYGAAHSLTTTQDGGVVVAGSLREEGTNDRNIYLFKVDTEGKLAWKTTKELSGSAELFSVQETHTGAIIATGRFEFSGWRIPFYPLLLRTDAEGHISNIGPVLSTSP